MLTKADEFSFLFVKIICKCMGSHGHKQHCSLLFLKSTFPSTFSSIFHVFSMSKSMCIDVKEKKVIHCWSTSV